MSFKKYTEMELLMLASIAAMDKEDMESIEMEKGDIDSITMEDHFSVPTYLRKTDASNHATRRKATFNKKESRKELARQLGYDSSTERNSKKVEDLLAGNHSDKSYFRGDKAERKTMSVKEEISLMEQESVETARESMMEEHNSIIGAIMQDIDTLTLDLDSNEHSIKSLESDYKKLEEAMTLVAEKLQNAKLRRNGIMAAVMTKECELEKMSAKLTKERISRFGW